MRISWSVRRGVAIAVASSIAMVACGGGSSPLSEDDFVRELEQICRDTKRSTDEIQDPVSETDFTVLEDGASEAASIYQGALDQLKELKPPKALQADFDDFVANIEDAIAAYGDLEAAAADENSDDILAMVQDFADLKDERNSIAQDLGADRCVNEDDGTDTPTTDAPTTESPTTMAPITVPPITQPDVTGTPDTIVTPTGDISTIDIVNDLAPPAGYTFSELDPARLQDLADTLAGYPDLGPIASGVGSVYLDDATGTVSQLMLFFWSEDIEGTSAGETFLNEFISTAATSEERTSAGGRPYVAYTDPDDSVGLVAIDGDVSLVFFGGVGDGPLVEQIFDAFLDANV